MHHTKTLINDERRIKSEKEKVRVALRNYGYCAWVLKEGEQLDKETDEEGGRSGGTRCQGRTGETEESFSGAGVHGEVAKRL